jgi:prefoldin subunit 5
MRMDSMQQQIDLLKDQIAAISERIAEMELEEETVQPLTITPWGE